MIAKCVIACAAPLLVSISAQGALLGLTLQPFPDINSGFISVSYNSGSDAFSANGFALVFNDDGVNPAVPISSGSFAISATVDNLGNDVSGSISIGGTAGSFGSPLLTGSLLDFGWSNVGLFEFIFSVTGGSLAIPAYYGNPGGIFGVIMDAGSNNFTGDWNVNFNNSGQGVSDAAPIPAPATLAVFLAAFCHGRRRR